LIITDSRHDVYSDNGRAFLVHLADADITKALVTNTGENVVVRLRFAAPIGPNSGHNGGIRIRTNTGLERMVDFLFARHINTLSLDRGVDIPTNCPVGLDREYTRRVIGFIVPRRCLHDPRWIRVNIEHDRQGHGPGGNQFDYWDTPHNNRPDSRALSPRVVYIPRLADPPASTY
jgi:hypothetical protein